MRKPFGLTMMFDPKLDNITVIRKVPEAFEQLKKKLEVEIRSQGGEPIQDGVVSIYTAKEDSMLKYDDNGNEIGAVCAVKMYGEFPE